MFLWPTKFLINILSPQFLRGGNFTKFLKYRSKKISNLRGAANTFNPPLGGRMVEEVKGVCGGSIGRKRDGGGGITVVAATMEL